MIVEFSDFVLEWRIPKLLAVVGEDDIVNKTIQDAVLEFIVEYERLYLLQFFSYSDFVDELLLYSTMPTEEQVDDDKNTLIKSLKPIVAKYVAYFWFKNESVQNTGIGAAIPQGQNATRTNNIDRMLEIWNMLVLETRDLYNKLFIDMPELGLKAFYPKRINNKTRMSIFEYENFLGI